jgi:hypothetical protein
VRLYGSEKPDVLEEHTPSSGLKMRESREESGVGIKLSSACCMTVLFTVIIVGTSDPTIVMF